MKSFIIRIAFSLLFIAGLFSCELVNTTVETDDTTTATIDSLTVKFENETSSPFTITAIEYLNKGPVITTNKNEDTENWSSNILPQGTTIAPGSSFTKKLKIPNGHWAQYRIGIDTGNGTQLMLHEQGVEMYVPEITHWGSHSRTVGVAFGVNQNPYYIYISGYWDFAGIE